MKISNKLESYNKIKNLKLNQFPEKVFSYGQENSVKEFLKKYPAKYYALRDKSKTGGITDHKIKYEDVLEKIKVYKGLFTINVSSYNYQENQLLIGEILVSGNNISFLGSTNNTYSGRDANLNPDFNIVTNIFNEQELNKIPYFDTIYKYIIEHNLENVIVEFALFNKPVGVNKENIIIYELRTEY